MEQKTPFRELSAKAKLQYIWDYYKLPIGAALLLIALLTGVIHHYATYKDPVLTLTFVNCSVDVEEGTMRDSFDDFMTENGYSTKKQEVAFNKSLFLDMSNPQGSTAQDLMSLDIMAGAQGISAIFADADTFDGLADRSYFLDITDFLSDSAKEQYADALVYATDDETNERYAAGIHLTKDNCSWLAETGAYEDCVVGICYDSDHVDAQKALLSYLLN